MRLHHFVVTLGAAAAPLTTNKAIVGSYISLQPGGDNAAEVFVGGLNSAKTQTVSATDYGIVLPAPVSAVAPAPYPLDPWNKGIQLTLNDVWVFGTAADTVSVTYWA